MLRLARWVQLGAGLAVLYAWFVVLGAVPCTAPPLHRAGVYFPASLCCVLGWVLIFTGILPRNAGAYRGRRAAGVHYPTPPPAPYSSGDAGDAGTGAGV